MASMEKIGIGGHLSNGYDVFIHGDTVEITKDDEKGYVEEEITEETVEGLGDFLEEAEELRIGWGKTVDFEIIYIYDKADDYFGYAVNLQDPMLSEWGYAPFR